MARGLLCNSSGKNMIIQKQVIEKSGIPLYKKLLHISTSSQKLVADNIAHVSTPGYQSKSLDFKSEIQAALGKQKIAVQTTDVRHIPSANSPKQIKVITNEDDTKNSGVNNVDIDKEMGALAENQILYTFGAKMLLQKFNGLRSVIKGRS
jgi:flagellar basal-body rod protein FlgB